MNDTALKVKTAPNSKESEMMVLGCMLTSINALNIAADGLDDADFYYTEHKIIFQVLKTAYKTDKPADIHLVCEELKRQEKLKAVGGASLHNHPCPVCRHLRLYRRICQPGQREIDLAQHDPCRTNYRKKSSHGA